MRSGLPLAPLGVVDDDESWSGRLLVLLTHGGLPRGLGEHPGCVQVVDPRLEKTGSQRQTQDFLGLQLQFVMALTHPGKWAGYLWGLRAGNDTKTHT